MIAAGAHAGAPGKTLGAGFWGGAVAGAAAGLIDGLWSWAPISQFLPGWGGKLELLLFLAASHALAGALVGLGGAAILLYFLRFTRLGDLVRFSRAAHREAHERDPREALIGLSLVVAGLPITGALVAGAYALAYRALAARHHIGLVIAVAMVIALATALLAVLLSFVAARPVEAALARIARQPRLGRALSSLKAPPIAAGLLALAALSAAAGATWKTISLLHLRPYVIALLAFALFWPSLRIGDAIRAALARRPPATRLGVTLGALAAMMLLVLAGGSPASVRKAARSYTGLGEPLILTFRRLGDLDRDGYSRFLGGGDCDDWNRRIHPGAPEIPDDGVDQNCVGGDVKTGRSIDEVAFAPVPPSVPADANVVLLTIDTLRADHLGAYGYQRPTSPTIDSVAAEGALFEHAWAHAPSTRYSMPAILTGRHPLEVDYDYSIRGWPGLSLKNTTIAEILKGRGMTTGAILNYWYFDPSRHMNQGFDHYDNSDKRLHRSIPGQGPAETRGSSSRQQSDKAIAYVRENKDRRFFLWVHYYDPHYRYEHHPGTQTFGERPIDIYDEEIRFTDHHIGRLIAELHRLGLWDKTIVVITGDHGEGFGEHGVVMHGYHLYGAQTRVPLIIRVPGLKPRRIATPAGHVDILPTLANLAGAEPTSDMRGRSLVDLLTGSGGPGPDRWVFQQLSYENHHEYRGAANATCHVLYNISPSTSWELYRVDRDPGETRDIIDHPGVCAGAKKALEVWYDRSEIPPGAAQALLKERPAIAHPVDVELGDEATLLDVKLPQRPVERGQTFQMVYTFAAHGTLDPGWRVFAHFESKQGGRFLGDHEPARPFSWWRPGQFIRYTREVTVPRHVRPGVYTLWTGLFRKNERRPARSDEVPVRDNRAAVGTITVQ